MAQLLIEIFTEEIPYSLQKKVVEDLQTLFFKIFLEYDIDIPDTNINIQATANRVAICINNLPSNISAKTTIIKGPNIKAPIEALTGFLKNYNTTKENCIIQETPKGSFYFYKSVTKGGKLLELLPEIIAKVLASVTFKKSMSWNNSKVLWGRPIRGLLGLFEDGKTTHVVPFNFAGIVASNTVFTHRILGKHNITVNSIAEYYQILADNFVVLKVADRINIITAELNKIIAKNNFKQELDNNLIQEIAYLVEYPVVLATNIPDEYMDLPKELLVNIIVKNQRYITFVKQDGTLASLVIIVANLQAKDGGKAITQGNLKVLKARLADGLFFYKNDLKTSLLTKATKLEHVTFFEGIGSIAQKTQRVAELFQEIFQEDQSYLCSLYKADLVSEVVVEIPELQGIMGYYYAKNDGASKEIATAILEHYKPISVEDTLPTTLLGAKLAIVDKLDTLQSLFAIGKIPTGSKDPFALRRAALGIIKIIIDKKFNIDLDKCLQPNLQEFILDRLAVYLKSIYESYDYSVDTINAQITKAKKANFVNIYKIARKTDLLLVLLKGNDCLQMTKRLENIIASQKDYQIIELQEDLFLESIEKELYKKFIALTKQNNNPTIPKAISVCEKIAPLLNTFLNTIVINKSATPEIKNNRISLLQELLFYIQNAYTELITQ